MPDQLDLSIPPAFTLTGAKLTCIMQKLAYHAIWTKQEETLKKRARTEANLENILADLKETFDIALPHPALWKSLRTQHFTQETSYFYWMTIHNAYMIGNHWLRPNMSEELKERAVCKTCGNVESMDHVLFRCDAPGQRHQQKPKSIISSYWLLFRPVRPIIRNKSQ